MALNFPNQARSYDTTRQRVRFWAHDSALEISFFVEAGALMKIDPDSDNAEAALLQVFDDGRERIHEVATAVYSRGRGFTYTLTASDF
ncbi:hypothetical protein BAL199_17028 [alpha proteobacterium BAL199]|jgi:hypothetical protein|nr:hypothetical protein BAL199_17028 [alpha proteobacterium BAL199]